MKIISFLNLSNGNKPTMDSGVNLHTVFFTELSKRGWECKVCSPIKFKIKGVKNIQYNSGTSKYDVRFRFEWNKVLTILQREQPDYIFVHQAELAANFRALIQTLGLQSKVLTYWHYMPVFQVKDGSIEWDDSLNQANLAQIILLRAFEGALSSDAFFVTSNFSKEMLLTLCKKYGIKLDTSKIFVLNPPADQNFLTDEKPTFKNSRQIFYNSRIYKHYGIDFILKVIKEPSLSDMDFILSDFFKDRNSERARLDNHVQVYRDKLVNLKNVILTDEGSNRFFYKHNLLLNSDLVLAPYRINSNWSMSSIDAMGLGIPVVAPNFAAYPEFIPESLRYESFKECIEIVNQLLHDRDFWYESSEECIETAKRVAPKNIIDNFVKFIP